MTRRIAVVVAMPEEAAAFFPDQGSITDGIRHLTHAEAEIRIAVSGIGKVNAAIAATRALALHPCDLILVIGTAGKIGNRPEPCFWLSAAVQHDYGARRAAGFVRYSAGTIPVGLARLEPFVAMADPGTGLPHAVIASGDSFVECPDASADLAAGLGADLVDMETAAIAQVAARFGVPWAGIRAVSDNADGASAGIFRDNLARVARAAGLAAEEFVGLVIGTG
jgi:adenosylhomocysteine nucleosidase